MENYRRNIILISLLTLSVLFVVMSILLTPSFLNNSFSLDGVLSNTTIYKINIFRLFSASLGGFLFIYFILKLFNLEIIEFLEKIFKERIIQTSLASKIAVFVIFIFLGIHSVLRIVDLVENDYDEKAKGYEYLWIAESIASGNGYSFDETHRWLFNDFESEYSSDKYYPTAWEEPIYTYFLGFSLKYFKNNAFLFIIITQILVLFLTSILIYLLVKIIFNSSLGIFASIILLLFWPEARSISEMSLTIATFAGFQISFSLFLFLKYLENRTYLRAVILGAVLGITCLTVSAAILIIPIVIIGSLLYKHQNSHFLWKQSLTIFLTFLVVLSPWVLRNWLVFDEIILIRNGAGQGLHMSNVVIASSFQDKSEVKVEIPESMWEAQTAEEAIQFASTEYIKQNKLFRVAHKMISSIAPEDYEDYNEAQRDKFYLQTTLGWIVSNPLVFIELSYHRSKLFFSGWQNKHVLITLLSLLSIVLFRKNKKVWILVSFLLAYAFIFTIIVALYYRYRYPVEPLFFVLASGSLIYSFRKLKKVNVFSTNYFGENEK